MGAHECAIVKCGMRHFTTLIDATTLAAQLERDDLALFDCRFELGNPWLGRDANTRARTFPARNTCTSIAIFPVPSPRSSGRHPLPDPHAFARRLGALGAGPDMQLVAYDQGNGAYAARLWWLARWIGLRNVAVLDGGIAAWRAAGLPLETHACARREPRQLPVTLADDAGARQRGGGRAAAATRATCWSTRAARNASPGATRPSTRSPVTSPARAICPSPAISARTEDSCPPSSCAGAGRRCSARSRRRALIAMCGSGVTACHNLLALEHAGLGGARLYAGSWSEWIRDPRRPIATGAY